MLGEKFLDQSQQVLPRPQRKRGQLPDYLNVKPSDRMLSVIDHNQDDRGKGREHLASHPESPSVFHYNLLQLFLNTNPGASADQEKFLTAMSSAINEIKEAEVNSGNSFGIDGIIEKYINGLKLLPKKTWPFITDPLLHPPKNFVWMENARFALATAYSIGYEIGNDVDAKRQFDKFYRRLGEDPYVFINRNLEGTKTERDVKAIVRSVFTRGVDARLGRIPQLDPNVEVPLGEDSTSRRDVELEQLAFLSRDGKWTEKYPSPLPINQDLD